MHAKTQFIIASTTPKVREASFDDYPQIALLQAERGIRVRSREEWRHLWADNPAYLDTQGKWPIGWVLQAGSGIVGYVGNIPARYELDGRRLTAAFGYSWVVAPAYAAYSILLLYNYWHQETAELCLTTTAGAQSYKAHIALGALPVPAGTWDQSSVWITNYRRFVASWLVRKKWPMPSVMSYPISVALSAKDAIRKRCGRKSDDDGSVEIECCDKFDERFDSFWEVLRAETPNTLLAERSRRILEWHFRYALRENKLWIATVKEGSCLCAYAIFQLKSNPTDEATRIVFLDFQSWPEKSTLFYPILRWALERCCLERIELLQTVGLCPKGVGDVSVLAPYNIRQQSWPCLYKALDRSLIGALSDPNAWVPSLFDGDASL